MQIVNAGFGVASPIVFCLVFAFLGVASPAAIVGEYVMSKKTHLANYVTHKSSAVLLPGTFVSLPPKYLLAAYPITPNVAAVPAAAAILRYDRQGSGT